LIQEAIDHGDTDRHAMQVADYWLLVSIYLFAELHHRQGTYFYEEK